MATITKFGSLSTIEIVRGDHNAIELNEALGEYASHKIFGEPGQFEKFTSLGFCRGDVVVAAVIYHNWLPKYGVVEISAASDDRRWLNRKTVHAILSEGFERKHCQSMFARVEAGAKHARIFEAIGFTETVLPDMRGVGKDELMFTLSRGLWRAGIWRLKDG